MIHGQADEQNRTPKRFPKEWIVRQQGYVVPKPDKLDIAGRICIFNCLVVTIRIALMVIIIAHQPELKLQGKGRNNAQRPGKLRAVSEMLTALPLSVYFIFFNLPILNGFDGSIYFFFDFFDDKILT